MWCVACVILMLTGVHEIIFSISASYMGKKFGWHEDMADHMKGVVLGVGESNCETNFPQC